MQGLAEAAEVLSEALRGVEGVVHFPDVGAGVDPPCTVLSPPRGLVESMRDGTASLTEVTWLVWLAVTPDDRATTRLLELLPRVVEALDALPDAVVRAVEPSLYPWGVKDLPAYQILVDYALN